jgi:predicted DNA-binding protein YlxM (UPF0122 family)
MDKNTHLTILYDIYGKLFSDKQREYFEDYYFNNLSLGEISENNNVSRNAVFKQLKTVENKLDEYESILKLYDKSVKLNKIIETVEDDKLKERLEKLNK